MHSKKQGFTLVELLVVISILAILSTVTTLGYQAFHSKALKADNVANADQWNIELKAYCTSNDLSISELTGIDIRTYLISTGKNIIPSDDSWTYAFNKSNNKVEVVDIDIFNSSSGTLNDLVEVTEGYYLIGQGSSTIEIAVTSLCYGDYNKVNNLDDEYYSIYKNYINTEYSKSNTIFLTPLTIIKDGSVNKVKNIILQEGLYFLPNISSLNNLSYTEDFRIINKNIKFIIAGSEEIASKLNVTINGSVNLSYLSTSLSVTDKDGNDISTNAIVNFRFGVEGIYYYLEDVNNTEYKVAITYLNREEVDGKIFLDNQITQIKVSCNIADAVKSVTYAKVYTSASGASLYKMSVLFYNSETILGYKEIYYVV